MRLFLFVVNEQVVGWGTDWGMLIEVGSVSFVLYSTKKDLEFLLVVDTH